MPLIIIDTELSNIDSREYSRGFIKELEINIKALVELETPNQPEYFAKITKSLRSQIIAQQDVNHRFQQRLTEITKEKESLEEHIGNLHKLVESLEQENVVLKNKIKHWEEFNTERCKADV